jgi:hypothetical protein
VQAQEVLSQSSFYSTNDTRLHFGLGIEKLADISIHWLGGGREDLKAVAADQLVVVKEGAGIQKEHAWSKAFAAKKTFTDKTKSGAK